MESSSPPTLPSGSPAPSTPTLDNPTPSSHTLGLTPTPNPTPASASASGPAADPTPSSENEASDPNKPNAPNTANTFDSLLDREQRAVAEMLSRFKNLVSLAKIDDNDGASATKEVAAAQAFALDVESVALVRAAEDLLQLSRELKEMWLFGPLRGIGEGEGGETIDEDSKKVGEVVEALLRSGIGAPGEGGGSTGGGGSAGGSKS